MMGRAAELAPRNINKPSKISEQTKKLMKRKRKMMPLPEDLLNTENYAKL